MPPPTLTSLAPPSLPLTQGSTGTLTATISAAQPADTVITLGSSAAGIASVPATVTVPTGALAVVVPVAAVAPGTATITASLNGSSLQSTVSVGPAGPTLTSLAPGTLQVTQGAAGSLTVTLSAAQPTDTVVPLTTSDSARVALPPTGTVTVPAGQPSQAFAVFGVSPGTATITATLNGTTVQSQVTVAVPLPTVVSLLPPILPLTVGSSGTLTVTLNASQPTATDIAVTVSDAAVVGIPATVTVPAGALTGAVPVTALALGTATVTASVNGTQGTSAVTVSPPPPTLQALTCPATVTLGATTLCTVTLTATQLTDTVVPLASSDAVVVAVPAAATVPAGSLAAPVPVTALALGTVTLTAGPLHATTVAAALQVVPPPPTLASLLPPETSVTVGATATLTLTLNAAQLADTPVALSASPASVLGLPATVTVPAGQLAVPVPVSGLSPGLAVVLAGPLTGTTVQSTVIVTQLPPTLAGLTPGTLSLAKGLAGTLTVTITPAQSEATIVPLAASPAGILGLASSVTIPAGAVAVPVPVTSLSVGGTTVTAGPLNGTTQQATITVTPPELVTLAITPPAPSIPKGETQQFTATGTYTDGTTPDLTGTAAWTSSSEAVATIGSGTGLATGIAEGEVTITATVAAKTATATLTVTPPVLATLAVVPTTATRRVGETQAFMAVGTLTDGTTQDVTLAVTWTSSDPAVATITSPGGLATALTMGTTTLTATHPEGFTATATLTVLLPPPTLTGFTPTAGRVGEPITLTGTNFLSVASVTFNGIAASSVTVASPTSLTAIVPPDATTGPLTVTTPGGTATSAGHFIVLPTYDVVLTVTPGTVSAVAGTSVTAAVKTAATGGFAGHTTLGLGTLPAGVTAAFSAPTLGPAGTGVLTLTTTGSTPVGAHAITVQGTTRLNGVSVTRTAPLLLQVQAPGQTLLAGQVRDEADLPLAGVSILYGWNPSTTLGVTDAGGNFQVAVPATGTFTVLLDGSTVSRPGVQYATVPVTVSVQAGVVNPLGYIPRLVPQARQTIPLVPGQETVLAPADIPGLEVRIPAGTTITGWDGQPNTQIGVVGVPIDRSGAPPLPAGVYAKTVYAYTFGKVGGGTPSQPVPITFPNDVGGNPGESLDLYYYDELPDGSQVNQWRKYGTGTVSADGTRVIPDTNPATGKPYGVPRFCCGYNLVINRTGWSDAGVAGSQVKAGEPVLLQTGIFLLEKTDLAVPGVPPLALTRTYRSGAPGDGPFGRGTSWTYDLSLLPPANGSPEQLRLILPGGSLNPFVRQPDGSFTAPGIPAFRGARITLEGPQRVLRFKDGAAWRFRTSDGLLASQTDRLGNTITITRDDATIGRALHIASATGQWLHLTYGGPEQPVIQVEDQAGRTVRYEYDGQRRLVAVTDPAGGVTRYTYDSSHRLLTITDPRAITFLVNEYDSAGRVFRQTQADTGIWQFAYTAPAGLITSTTVTDPRGQQTTSRFNAAGFLLAQTDALGQTTTYEREVGTNHLLSITDPLGRTSRYSYDPNGNVLTITNALNQTTTFTYEPSFNQVASITDPLGNRTTFAYDPQGNLLSITDPEQNQRPEADRLKTTFTYNPYGQPLTAADPLGHTTAFEYDAAGNLTATIDPLGNRTERGYDVVGRLVTQTDPLGNRTQFSYDPLNRLLALTDPLNGMTRFGYDPNGNLLTVTDAKGHTLTHEYDAMDRLHRRTDPLGKPETFQYDGNGNLVSTTDRKNQTSTFTYDGVNRRTKAEFADGAVATFTYDTGGRLTQAEDTADPHRPIAMTYDPLDRLLTETTTLGTVSYAYDALGRRTSMVVSGQAPVTYAYDANSRLTGLTQAPLTPVSLQYDAANRRTLLTLPNGVSTEYVYDLGSRLTALIYRNAQGTLGDLTYTYDPTGNRVGVGGSWARSLVPEAVTSASYDSANRQLSFGASTITFDDNGNLATLTEATGTTTYTWDSRNRLTGLAGSPVNASFAYDALGRRAHKIIGSAMTQFHYDGLHPVIEHGSSGPTPLLYGAGFDEIFRRGEAFYLVDSLQSVVALADAEGGLMTDYRYEPFGRAVSSSQSENPLQFIARENDGTGLTHHRLRYYSPTLHRFISQDPLGAWGGDRNLYAYALNSPVTLRDFVGGPAVAPIAAGLVIGKAIVGMISGGVGGYITSGSAAGTAVGALAGGLAGAATSPITSEAAGALATGAFSSAAGQLAGNLVEGKPMGSNFSVLAVAGAGAGSVLGTPVTAVVVPRAAQAVANIAGAAVSRPQALQVAGSAGASAGIMTQGIIDGAFTGLGESGGGKLQSAISTGRPSKAEPIPWPLPPGFPFAP